MNEQSAPDYDINKQTDGHTNDEVLQNSQEFYDLDTIRSSEGNNLLESENVIIDLGAMTMLQNMDRNIPTRQFNRLHIQKQKTVALNSIQEANFEH